MPASLDLGAAEQLHVALQALVARDAPIRIDASPVERVSTAALQVLVATAMAARQHGLAFALAAPSGILREASHDLGLDAALGLEPA